MINRIEFERFRGLKELCIPELKQVTLISGKNNAGKTSVLEGVFMVMDHMEPESFVKISRFRGLPVTTEPISLWTPMFHDLNTEEPIRISMLLDDIMTVLEYSRDDSFVPSNAVGAPQDVFNQFLSSAKSSYTLKAMFTHGDYCEEEHFITSATGVMRNGAANDPHNHVLELPYTQYINQSIANNDNVITEWFGKMEIKGEKQKIIDYLKMIDESICDVTTIAMQGQIQLYGKMGEKLLPLKLAGDGMSKLLFIVLAIIANPNSLILIDEIETGLHYSKYSKLWEVVAAAARDYNCQIIATTHSYECIGGAIEGIEAADMMNDFCYYRIEQREKSNRAFKYSGALLRSAITTNMEVR